MKRILLFAALVCFTSVAQAGGSGDMNEADLLKAVTGKTVNLSTSGIALLIAHGANGTMGGRLNAIAASLAGGTPVDTGRWWITSNQLCHRWNYWLKGKTYCYKLTRQGRRVVWLRHDGRRGTVRLGG